jgi:hypothetical protein
MRADGQGLRNDDEKLKENLLNEGRGLAEGKN